MCGWPFRRVIGQGCSAIGMTVSDHQEQSDLGETSTYLCGFFVCREDWAEALSTDLGSTATSGSGNCKWAVLPTQQAWRGPW